MRGSGRAWWAVVALTPAIPWLATLPGGAWLLPLLAPLTIWPLFRRAVVESRHGAAFAAALAWAALYSAGVIGMVALAPELARGGVLRGEAYRSEMFEWILTGRGVEVTPSAFLPVHAGHLGTFLLMSAVSGGYLGLSLGAFLVGYMSYFVGAFAVASGAPVTGALLAWVPWSAIRVLSFVLLGVLAARPLLLRKRWPFGRNEARLALLAAAGLVLDVLLKAFWAPTYGALLREWLVGAGGR